METVACDLCNKNDARRLWDIPDQLGGQKELFTIVRCNNCGLVFVNPRPGAGEIERYYPDGYEPYRRLTGLKRYLKIKLLLKREASRLRRFMPERGRILELGIGSGEDLAFLERAGQWEVLGADVSDYAVREAVKKFGLNARAGRLESLALESNSFDYVRMKYVLSHVHSPLKVLQEAERILKPGGRICLWIPNFDSLCRMIFGRYWEGQEPPRHLYNFSENTISSYLELAGLEAVSVSHSVVPNTFIHSFRNILTENGFPGSFARLFRINLFTLFLFFPFSLVASFLRMSDRLTIVARKPNKQV